MSGIRTFIALPTPPSVKEEAGRILSEFQQINADVKWDSPEKLHITLKFLGSVEAQVLEKLIMALKPVASQQTSFDIVYETLGAFPNIIRPRVVWVGAKHNDSLSSLQKSVEDVCSQLGFAKEDREFHPHLTLGRVKGSRNIHLLTDKLKSITLQPITSRCTELLVMRSDLRPSGSVYSVLASIAFKP